MSAYSRSKWGKYKAMRRSARLVPHLPETSPLSSRSLGRLLGRYGTAIVKPYAKSGGAGVHRIQASKSGRYTIRWERSSLSRTGLGAVMGVLRSHSLSRSLAQRYVRLASVNGRPFDIRVMVQRGKGGGWQVTGKLAKVAGPGYIVTNMKRSRGYVTTVTNAVRRSGCGRRISSVLRELDNIALSSAVLLRNYYPGIRTVGLDIALDRDGKLWIIEANFMPSVSLFAHLKDKSAYRTILRLKGTHGKRR